MKLIVDIAKVLYSNLLISRTFAVFIFSLADALYLINVKTAQPIGPNFFDNSHVIREGLSLVESKKKIYLKKIWIFTNFKNSLI